MNSFLSFIMRYIVFEISFFFIVVSFVPVRHFYWKLVVGFTNDALPILLLKLGT